MVAILIGRWLLNIDI